MRKFIFISLLPFFIFSHNIQAQPVLSKNNLVAWCIVPFDAAQRNPKQRAEMLHRLGFKAMAYDWRESHIPEFDEEVAQLKKSGIKMVAFWWTGGLPENNETLKNSSIVQTQLDFFRRNNLELDVWVTLSDQGLEELSDEGKYEKLAQRVDLLANEMAKLNCRVGLYNHGGWGGQPAHMVGVVKKLKSDNVGLVYNYHHAHDDLENLDENFNLMVPYLYCVNLNGMNRKGPKILPIGQGEMDLEIITMIKNSSYKGPIGIIGHVEEEDVEVVLNRNLEGLKALLLKAKDRKAYRTFM
jgi:hypothetical protein